MTDRTVKHILGAVTREAFDRAVIQEAQRLLRERGMTNTQVESFRRTHNTEPGIRCWCLAVHAPTAELMFTLPPVTANQLDMIFESAETMLGHLDRPAEGTEITLRSIMAMVIAVRARSTYPEALPKGSTVEQYADAMMVAITDDMLQPFPHGKWIPWNVGSFSALHDYCDANEYLPDVMGEVALNFSDDDDNAMVNRVLDEVAKRLAKMALNGDKAIACGCDHGFHEVAPARGCLSRGGCPCQGFFQPISPSGD